MHRLIAGLSILGFALTATAAGQERGVWERVIARFPEPARAFAAGADPETLLLDDGTTFGELIARAAPPASELLYTPVSPCRVVWTRASSAGRLLANVNRNLKIRPETVDLSGQGGSPAGCGVPAAAEAVMVVVRDLGPSEPGLLRARAFGPNPWQQLVYFTPHLSPPRFANSTILGLCSPQASCSADFSLRATADTDAIVEVVGYFTPHVATGFGELASGSNTSAAMVVGTGASLETAGGGTIAATTAAALAADGADCPPGSYARGVDAAGNATGCSPDVAGTDHDRGSFSTAVGQDAQVPSPMFANTALGALALEKNSGGESNTATGAFALRNNTSGIRNTATGAKALELADHGWYNTATGYRALYRNDSGSSNTATGTDALALNEGGSFNTALGFGAMSGNETGFRNTAVGTRALARNTAGNRNAALGVYALSRATGSDNVGVGYEAGAKAATGSNNVFVASEGEAADDAVIRVGTPGTHARTFVAGVRDVTTDLADALPVYVDSAGQLGTASSSRRYKEEIRDMGSASERLLGLRPVTFRYRKEFAHGEKPIQFGLIAEEVAEVFPELVVLDREGEPESVKYHLLASLLLNELQNQVALNRRQEAELAELRALIEQLRR